MNEQRYLCVISGPSGVGKDTVVTELIKQHSDIELSVSATTRPPRPGETHGCHYHFITPQQFAQWQQQGLLLESACYNGNCYGTPKAEVDKRIHKGITVILVIEVEGMANIKALYPDCITIFLMPPTQQELESRLRNRSSETEAQIQGRLQRAKEEMRLAKNYDYQLVNHDAQACAQEIYDILQQRQ